MMWGFQTFINGRLYFQRLVVDNAMLAAVCREYKLITDISSERSSLPEDIERPLVTLETGRTKESLDPRSVAGHLTIEAKIDLHAGPVKCQWTVHTHLRAGFRDKSQDSRETPSRQR